MAIANFVVRRTLASSLTRNRSPGPGFWSAGKQTATTSTSDQVACTRSLSRSPSSVRGRCSPGVSTRISCASGRCTMPRTTVRVVCGREDVIATLVPTIALVSVDLPAFGRPTKQAKPDLCRRPARSSQPPRADRSRPRSLRRTCPSPARARRSARGRPSSPRARGCPTSSPSPRGAVVPAEVVAHVPAYVAHLGGLTGHPEVARTVGPGPAAHDRRRDDSPPRRRRASGPRRAGGGRASARRAPRHGSSTADRTDSPIRAIAGSAVRSPASTTHSASSGRWKDPFGSPSPRTSPTQSVCAHEVTSPSSWITTSSVRLVPSSERTV